MLRTPLDKAYIKRTLRQLYGFTQTTPKDCLLDPSWDRSVDIYPGMVLMNKATGSSGAGDVVTLLDATGVPYGLCGLYIAPVYGIDEVRDQGINSVPVWTLTPDAEFEVLAPAFDDQATWTFPTDGTELLVHAYTGASGSARGKLCPAGATGASTKPVARAISRPSSDRLIISGLLVGTAY